MKNKNKNYTPFSYCSTKDKIHNNNKDTRTQKNNNNNTCIIDI